MLQKLREFAYTFLVMHLITQCIFGMYYIYSMLFNMENILTWLITVITGILQWYAIGCYLDDEEG